MQIPNVNILCSSNTYFSTLTIDQLCPPNNPTTEGRETFSLAYVSLSTPQSTQANTEFTQLLENLNTTETATIQTSTLETTDITDMSYTAGSETIEATTNINSTFATPTEQNISSMDQLRLQTDYWFEFSTTDGQIPNENGTRLNKTANYLNPGVQTL